MQAGLDVITLHAGMGDMSALHHNRRAYHQSGIAAVGMQRDDISTSNATMSANPARPEEGQR